jgi:hypothetical protein
MEVTTTKCDICGKKEDTDDYNEPKDWYRLKRQGDRDKDFWARHRDICHECATKMGLPQICIKYKPANS